MKVLICDDEPTIRLLYRSAFELAGASVDLAEDASACLRSARDDSVDLVVLDVRLPGRDGLAALADIRQMRPALPVVLVTAEPSPSAFVRGRELGAAECIDKLEFLARIPGLVHRYTAVA